jgi:hypothetical protein
MAGINNHNVTFSAIHSTAPITPANLLAMVTSTAQCRSQSKIAAAEIYIYRQLTYIVLAKVDSLFSTLLHPKAFASLLIPTLLESLAYYP